MVLSTGMVDMTPSGSDWHQIGHIWDQFQIRLVRCTENWSPIRLSQSHVVTFWTTLGQFWPACMWESRRSRVEGKVKQVTVWYIELRKDKNHQSILCTRRINVKLSYSPFTENVKFGIQIGSHRPKMGQIWDFLRSVSVHFENLS